MGGSAGRVTTGALERPRWPRRPGASASMISSGATIIGCRRSLGRASGWRSSGAGSPSCGRTRRPVAPARRTSTCTPDTGRSAAATGASPDQVRRPGSRGALGVERPRCSRPPRRLGLGCRFGCGAEQHVPRVAAAVAAAVQMYPARRHAAVQADRVLAPAAGDDLACVHSVQPSSRSAAPRGGEALVSFGAAARLGAR